MDSITYYIILGVIWLIIRAVSANKKKKVPKRSPQSQPRAGGDADSSPKSFEELLKQLGQDIEPDKPAPAPAPAPAPKPTYKQPDPVLESVDRSYESRIQRINEEAAVMERRAQAMSDEVSRMESDITRQGRFEEFKIQEKKENYYKRLLKDPQGMKDAIVVSEILNRPYE